MKKHGFAKALAIYAAVLVLLIAGGLFFLWHYLDAYEQSLPAGVIEAYEQNSLHADYRQALRDYVGAGNPFQSPEEILAWLDTQLDETTLRLKKTGTADAPVYSIRLDGRSVGTLYLQNVEGGRFGFDICALSHVEWSLPEDLETLWTVKAPEETQVLVNGIALTEQNSECSLIPTNRGALIQSVEPVNDRVYTFRYFGSPEISTAEDPARVYTMTETGDTARSFSAVCADSVNSEITALVAKYVDTYVLYTAARCPFSTLEAYLVPDSDLYVWIRRSIGTRQDVRTGVTVVDDLRVDNIVPYGDGILCDAHYQITDYRCNVFHLNLQLLFVNVDGELRVLDMGNY